jgi:hypothetical protein
VHSTGTSGLGLQGYLSPDILHLSQQDLKNRVYQRIINAFRLPQSQEARFLVLVQDMSHRNFKVVAPDPDKFDGDKDGDGIRCEE